VNYHVHWQQLAFEQMDAIARGNPDYVDMLAAALSELAQALRSHPTNYGESREGNDRVGFPGPLVVTFRVLHADRQVQVLRVRLTTLLL
jgi:hypothetical protein